MSDSFFSYSLDKFKTFERDHQLRVLKKILLQMENSLLSREKVLDGDCFLDRRLEPYLEVVGLREIAVDSGGNNFNEGIDSYLARVEAELEISIRDYELNFGCQEDRSKSKDKLSNVSLVFHNIRSAYNIGSFIRSAECFGIGQVFFSGYTATPENPLVEKTSMGAQKWQESQKIEDWQAWVEKKRETGAQIFAIETAMKAESLFEKKFSLCEGELIFIFGNERYGLSEEILNCCDQIICLPMFGVKNSLNVASTASILAFELRRQALLTKRGE